MAQSGGSKRKEWIHGTFTQVPNAVFAFLPDMSASAFATYCVLAKHANTHGKCFPKIKTLAKTRGVSERAINRDLNELHDLGLLNRSRMRYGNEYILIEPATTKLAQLRSDRAVASGESEPSADATEPSHQKRQYRRMRSDKAVANKRTIRREQETKNNIPPDHPDSSQVEDGAPINSVSEFGAEPDPGDPEQPCQDFSDSSGEEWRTREDGREEENDEKLSVSIEIATSQSGGDFPQATRQEPPVYFTPERLAQYQWTYAYFDGLRGEEPRDDYLTDVWTADFWEFMCQDRLDGHPRDAMREALDAANRDGSLPDCFDDWLRVAPIPGKFYANWSPA